MSNEEICWPRSFLHLSPLAGRGEARRSTYVSILAAVLAFLSAAIIPCLAQDDAPALPQAAGAWRIEPPPEKDTTPDKLAAVTSALDNKDATLALWCKPDVPVYYFILHDPRLARLALGDDVVVGVQQPGEAQVRFAVSSPGDASVIVQERVHQVAFALLLGALNREGAAQVELALDQDQWVFSLDGFRTLLPSLTERCGAAPNPWRGIGQKPANDRRDQLDRLLPHPRRK